MKTNYLLLLLCSLSSQSTHTAAERTFTYITADLPEYIQQANKTLAVPLTKKEPISGTTLASRARESIEKGLPLMLTYALFKGEKRSSSELIDLCSLIRTSNTWDNSILTPETTIVDGNVIEEIRARTVVKYATEYVRKNNLSPCDFDSHTFTVGPFYRSTVSLKMAETRTLGPNKLTLKNVTFDSLTLLYEFTKDARILTTFLIMYAILADSKEVAEYKPDFIEAQRKILKTIEFEGRSV